MIGQKEVVKREKFFTASKRTRKDDRLNFLIMIASDGMNDVQ